MHAFTLIEMILAIGVAAMVLIAVNTAICSVESNGMFSAFGSPPGPVVSDWNP